MVATRMSQGASQWESRPTAIAGASRGRPVFLRVPCRSIAGNRCGPIAVPLHYKANDLSSDIAQEVAPMAHVVCIVEADEKKVSVTWSDGTGAFKPYELTGPRLELFRGAARKCREQLDAMARDYL